MTEAFGENKLREKCPYSEFFWFVFSIFGLNTDQKNSEYGHFSRNNNNDNNYDDDSNNVITRLK